MNRLAGAASAYLASAAHQPVHWFPWGDEAFARARKLDRPILLDVGAVWCHWCHIMDRESYEDPALAAYLNEHFVCVKVDRDERPDVDVRYQRAVQAVAGQGGWPLTAFLTPDGDVFFGGTYFPPDGGHGRPGFRTVLEKVLEAFRDRRAEVLTSAAQLRAHVGGALAETAPGDPTPALLDAAAARMAGAFDARHGGFGGQPKFPHPAAVEFLLARWWDSGEALPRDIVERTLDGMAQGGMYDQLGGGFHRYSVDARWIVPHFEKMSYDNAELLKAYVHAYAALGKPLYREVAEGIIRWSLEVLADREQGGFGASQDADVGSDDDGDYFTWTADEASADLIYTEWEAARRHWDIEPQGEMHHDPSRNVLFVARSTAEIAGEMGVAREEVERLLASAAVKLRASRALRPAPFVDRTRYTAWNAMLAEAFLDAAAVLGREDCRDFALRTLERLWAESWRDGEGMAHHPGSGSAPPLLDDQVQAASAAISAFEHTGDEKWIRRALALAEVVMRDFHDGRVLRDRSPAAPTNPGRQPTTGVRRVPRHPEHVHLPASHPSTVRVASVRPRTAVKHGGACSCSLSGPPAPTPRRRHMRADDIEVRNPSGLHARPAALFVKTAARFTSAITVQNVTTGSAAANAKSILAVMGSGAGRGHIVRLTADGPDEEQAITVLHDLFASGLGEELEA